MSETLAEPEVAKAISPELDFSVLENAPEGAPPQPNPEELKIPNGEALKQFEDEILGGPLPPEIKQKVDELREAKNSDSAAQSAELAQLIDEATSGLFGRWIDKGRLTVPSTIEGHEQDLISKLDEVLEDYLETPAGKKDAEIRQLRLLLDGKLDAPQTKAISETLGARGSKLLSVIPGQSNKYKTALMQAAERRLNELAPSASGYDEKPTDWRDEVRREASGAEYQADQTISDATQDLDDAIEAFQKDWRYGYDPNHSSDDLDRLRSGLSILEAAREESSEALERLLPEQTVLLSMLARGSVRPEEVVKRLKSREKQAQVDLHGLFRQIVTKQWLASRGRLAEPSLVGLSLTETEIAGVDDNLDKIDQLTEIYGLRPDFSTEAIKAQVHQNILDAQKLFFEKLGSESELYWHFDAQGLKIIESGELQSGAKIGGTDRNTGEWSTGVHFTKPGSGMNSHDNYPGYATTTLKFGTKEKIEEAFGVAIIYKLGDVVKQTPLRAEPIIDANRGRANISEDVTFRPEDGSDEYAYDLNNAYMVPMATYGQLKELQDDPRFTDIFEQPPGNPHLMARQILERSLKLAGHSDEWIAEHVIPYWETVTETDADINNAYSDRSKTELQLQASVSRKIQTASPPSRKLIAALSAKKGLPEALGHVYGISPQVWTEQLIALETHG